MKFHSATTGALSLTFLRIYSIRIPGSIWKYGMQRIQKYLLLAIAIYKRLNKYVINSINVRVIRLTCTLLLIESSSVFAQAENKPASESTAIIPAVKDVEPIERKWYDKVEFSGFVDVYYMYNNNPLQGNSIDTTRAFETSNKNFAINAVSLVTHKTAEKSSPWGFRVDFQNGQNNAFQETPYTTSNQIYNMNMLKQAYVSFFFPVLKGMTLDVGKMATHIGYELLESMNNPNYSIGAIFQNTIPFIHTGARLTTQINNNWSGTVYLYNSGQGTGYLPPTSATLTDTTHSPYVEAYTQHKSIGTQLKGQLIENKLAIIWNTIYSQDFPNGRMDATPALLANYANTGNINIPADPAVTPNPIAPTSPRAKYNKDYWAMSHTVLSVTPTDRIQIDLDYTWSQKAGIDANAGLNQQRYNPNNTITATNIALGYVTPENVKSIYKAYGIFSKFKINETWGVNVRYEYLDDKLNNGALNTFAPNAFGTNGINNYISNYQLSADTAIANAILASNPQLNALLSSPNGLQAIGAQGYTSATGWIMAQLNPTTYKHYNGANNYGQYRTFTITPVWNFTENLLIKLDIRRDWSLGKQFVDAQGHRRNDQIGFTLGIVAKF
ncbi:outer membrane protein [Leptospira fainei serovar Hurstbridge str. BUT 6]|uniref:Outer membrane protein n=1 Tax=Leptospira fainei serovar Hurstbridge str. BUT 6 TaxID=1193011 RepID=S3V6R8_9LEPT|nr:outer membrane beta-barrel protein [Leptospira fainei]EPG76359.1 outer membrane protein [Leptospira fainei serovar Hurstbridge str. BUT 6]